MSTASPDSPDFPRAPAPAGAPPSAAWAVTDSALAEPDAEPVVLPADIPGAVGDPATSDDDDRTAIQAGGAPFADFPPVAALVTICVLLRARTGHDFAYYKREPVLRRIERRMVACGVPDLDAYARYLAENPAESDLLFRELLIGVTRFFRDPEAFTALAAHLPALLADKEPDAVVRVWAPGCSTGEEAYSLTMLLLEALDVVPRARYLRMQLFATDINPAAVEAGRFGYYPASIAEDVSEARLARFFVAEGAGYRIRKELRDVVVFAVHDLNRDAPFTRLDVLCCRNLLIYLSAELQQSLLPIFHYALLPGGLLLLGPSENLHGQQELFTPLDTKWKLARRIEALPTLHARVRFPLTLAAPARAMLPAFIGPGATPARRENVVFAERMQRMLLHRFGPPAVVISLTGDILYIHSRTGRYLEPAAGLSGLNLLAMARPELGAELSAALHQAVQQQRDVVLDAVRVRTDEDGNTYRLVRLAIRHLAEPEAPAGLLLVTFEDAPAPRKSRGGKGTPALAPPDPARDAALAALDRELQHTRFRLQATIEDMDTSLEELKSTNEELQSTNEELQSTNEEAMTNKEEMLNLNEALQSLNAQHLAKTEELSDVANDIKNLLDATDIGVIFLDHDLVIKRFTPSVTRIIPLLPADIGRPITHFAATLRYEALAADVQTVLDRLAPLETTMQAASGEWYALRILPYRTLDNYIRGAVITFTDITGLKTLDAQLQASTRLAERIVETIREPVLVLDRALRVVTASQAFVTTFGLDGDAPFKGEPLAHLNGGAWHDPVLHQRLRGLLANPPLPFDDLTWIATLPGLGLRRLTAYGRSIQLDGTPTGPLLLGVQAVEEATADE